MLIGKYQFRPKLWAIIFTLVILAIFIRLGFWQLDRADEKRAIQQQQQKLVAQGYLDLNGGRSAKEVFEYQKAEVSGMFLTDRIIFLDNKPYNGIHGYHVLTPLKIKDTNEYILVNRGWVPMKTHRENLPGVETSDRLQHIKGMIKFPSSQFTLGDAINENNQWPWRIQWLEMDAIEKQLGVRLLPYILLQDSEANSEFIRDWKIVISPPEKNVSYAVQWFSFAFVLLIIFIVVNSKKIRSE
jgi:surfeit locus 1 family protein